MTRMFTMKDLRWRMSVHDGLSLNGPHRVFLWAIGHNGAAMWNRGNHNGEKWHVRMGWEGEWSEEFFPTEAAALDCINNKLLMAETRS